MDIFLTIIAVIIIFSIVVLVHEYGHFTAARRSGIKVLEFGIGFPPRLFKKKIGETIYSINAIPIGGFVKMQGEDDTSVQALRDKRSFAHKSPLTRAKVVLAGVFMNFVLAIILLTIGFSFGIEPLLATEDDLFYHLEKGNVISSPGIFVDKIAKKAEQFGVSSGDKIILINDKPVVSSDQAAIFQKGGAEKDIDVVFAAKDGAQKKLHIPLIGKDKYYGIDLKPYTEFPRIAILDIKEGSKSERAGLKRGDVILQINGQEIYAPEDFWTMITQFNSLGFTILRDSEILQIPVTMPDQNKVVITDVDADLAAFKAGLLKGDIIVEMNGETVARPEQVQEILKKNPAKEIKYTILRNGAETKLSAKTGDKNLLGVVLSYVSSFRNSEISVYRIGYLTSITEIKKVRYSPFQAFKQSISETMRLTVLTVQAFGRMVKSVVSKFVVPAEVGGPVQIAYYTHTFVQEGFLALLRFTALLSLSLGVINVLPVPALDGGRLLFIIIEVVLKKKINARLESFAHSLGFILLMFLIILVTYSDITKLF